MLQLFGAEGRHLAEAWGREPRAYLGVVAPPAFPNLYFFYGPNTNSGHHSIIAHAECEVNYVIGCCQALIELNRNRSSDQAYLDVKPQVFNNYIDQVSKLPVQLHPNSAFRA